MTEETLGHRVKKGYLWTLLGTGVSQPLTFLIGVALARILDPADFGIATACLIFTEVASTLVSSSYVSTLLQRRVLSDLELSTAFVLISLTGGGTALLLVAFSPVAASLYHNAAVTPVLCALSLNLLLLPFSSMPSVLARRGLDFRLLVGAQTLQTITYGAIGVGMAVAGSGVWSLVVARLAGYVLQAVVLIAATGWRPSIRFDRPTARALFKPSLLYAAKNSLGDLARNVDYFIVGSRLDMQALGYYSRAYYVMTLPISRFSESLGAVLFPAFSKMQDEPERLVRGFLKTTCLIAMTTFPILTGAIVVARDAVPLIYGAKWTPMVLPLQILCLAGLFYSLDPPAVSLINARAYLADEIKRQLVHIVLLVVSILWCSRWGLKGVAWAVTGTAMIYWMLVLQLLRARLRMPILRYLSSLVPGCVGSLGIAAAVMALRQAVATRWPAPHVAVLSLSVAAGVVAYLACVLVVRFAISGGVIGEAFTEVDASVAGLRRRVFGRPKDGVE